MRINTNLTAMNTYTQYTKNNNKIASAVEKLSSVTRSTPPPTTTPASPFRRR